VLDYTNSNKTRAGSGGQTARKGMKSEGCSDTVDWDSDHMAGIVSTSGAGATPRRSDALAFQTRTLPSSEPERTKRASAVKSAEETRCIRFVRYTSTPCPCALLPHPHCAVPPLAHEHESEPRRRQVAGHHGGHVALVDLRRHSEVANVESVEVVVLGCEEEGGGRGGGTRRGRWRTSGGMNIR
jgi:hypothetical protein